MRRLLALLVSVFLLLPLCAAAGETDEVYLAEPFGCEDLDGNPFDVSLFDGAQLLLIDVWEPWCPWCLEEMPDLNELYELNRENGFLIVGLSGVSTAPGYDAKKTAADMGITYPLVNGTDALLPFRPEGFPSTYVYQRQEDGRFLFLGVITGYMPREDWNRFLTENLPGAVTEAAAAAPAEDGAANPAAEAAGLEGKWNIVSDHKAEYTFANGKMTMTTIDGTVETTYQAEGNKLTIFPAEGITDEAMTFEYKVEGDTMTWNLGGTKVTFTR